MPILTILPEGKTISLSSETPVMEALRDEEIYIKSSCGGVASCSDCVVKVIEGAEHCNPPPFEETRLLGNVFHITKERLSCQLKCTGDLTIDISRHDKAADEDKLKNKTSSFVTKRRTKDDVSKIREDRAQERAERPEGKEGGKRRPRPFRTDVPPKPRK
ncbi:MAG: 2Fe-2S iron-sulfur cluster-binding protein [bacterium]